MDSSILIPWMRLLSQGKVRRHLEKRQQARIVLGVDLSDGYMVKGRRSDGQATWAYEASLVIGVNNR